MDSQVVFKVKYGDTLRRFTVPVNGYQQLDLTVNGLRDKISSLFKFSNDVDYTLTYVDEDGDVVTLDDFGDLIDIARQCLNPVRITVKLNTGTSAPLSTPASGTSTPSVPLSTPASGTSTLPLQVPNLQPNFNAGVAEVMKAVPEPFREAFSKLSVELASKVATSPVFADLIDSFAKVGQSFRNGGSSLSGTSAVSAPPETSEKPKESFTAKQGKEVAAKQAAEERTSSRPVEQLHKPMDVRARMPGFPAPPSPPVSMQPPIGTSGYVDVPIFHRGVRCDGCGVHPITGPRYKSKVKYNYDLCSICFAQMGSDADYIRIDFPAPCRGKHVNHLRQKYFFPVPPLLPPSMKQLRPRLDSRFVMDVNVMDGTVMGPQTPFTKIWRMRNNGTLPWPCGTRLTWIGGDKLSAVDSVEVEIPLNGLHEESELDLAVDFVAPELPGRYVSYWRMQSPLGQKFGQRVWVLIVVDASLKDAVVNSTEELNLNLPPVSSAPPDDIQSLEVNGEALVDVNHGPGKGNNTNAVVETEESVIDECLPKVDLKDTGAGDFFGTASMGSLLGDGYEMSTSSNAGPPITSSSPVSWDHYASQLNPTSGSGSPSNSTLPSVALSSVVPDSSVDAAPSGVINAPKTPVATEATPTVSYPFINLSVEGTSSPATDVQQQQQEDPTEVRGGSDVEQTLLKELKEMGFNEVELNKEVLRKTGYNLESSLDELCGISEWDPLLEELQEMGFYDKETNRRLLVKNNGSLKHVVMDLIAGEKSVR